MHTECMQKLLLAAAAFVIGATLGMGVLAAIVVVAALLARHGGSLALFAGSIGHGTVLLVPTVCGALAACWAVRRINRLQG